MKLNEFEIIRNLFKPLSEGASEALGLSDDAALYSPPEGYDTVFSKDLMAAGVHFPADARADMIAGRLLRVNLSDLAAMGAEPVGYLLGLGLTADEGEDWLASFADGLREAQQRFGLALWGGDTIRTNSGLCLSLTAIGRVPRGQALRRNGARAGDKIVLSGTLGNAALALPGLGTTMPDTDVLATTYWQPTPRLELGQALRGMASSAIDVSDGLLADLGHICAASGVGAQLEADKIPISDAARQHANEPGFLSTVLTGGDDYELVFTVHEDDLDQLKPLSTKCGVELSIIGDVVPGGGVNVFDESGEVVEFSGRGYRHF